MTISTAAATLNAKVAAVGLIVGAVGLDFLNQFAPDLVPLRLMAAGALIFGAWAFCDEMGLRKPLNRAGFVTFAFAMFAVCFSILDPAIAGGKLVLVYAFALLFAMLIWSAAFLHRKRDVKLAGAVGALASLVPLAALILGHVSIGAGAWLGVDALLQMDASAAAMSNTPIKVIEAMFVFWSAGAAGLLWLGRISPGSQIETKS